MIRWLYQILEEIYVLWSPCGYTYYDPLDNAGYYLKYKRCFSKLIFQTYFESRTFELSYLQKHQVGIANLLAKEQRIAWVSLGHLRFLSEIDQKVPIFVEKLKKIQPLKMTFRSQLEPSIKSYECFMFFLNFRLEMTLDWGILERL